MSQAYKSAELTVVAVQWDGNNYDEITDLTGPDNAVHVDGEFQVRLGDGRWESLFPGWWVVKHPDGGLQVASKAAFAKLFIPG